MVMLIEGNHFQWHFVETDIPLGAPVSLIPIAIYTTGLQNWVELTVQGLKFLSCGESLYSVTTWCDVNQVMKRNPVCDVESIQ